MSEAPEVSVVAPVFNKADALPSVVAALVAQGLGQRVEYIFVDDASSDRSLDVLRELSDGVSRLRIIANKRNAGPAIRLNQGAEAAQGRYLCLIDADEIMAPCAMTLMLRLLKDTGADCLHAKVARSNLPLTAIAPSAVGPEAEYNILDRPMFDVVRGRGFVRMAWLVEADLFRSAGGCDPRIFIQDESLPLRLAAKAKRMVDLRMCLMTASEQGTHLSDSLAQQHHDGFFAAYNMLRYGANLSEEVGKALAQKCFSMAWKATRDCLASHRSRLFADYVLSRVAWGVPRREELERIATMFRAVPGIRRPGVEES